MVRGAATRYGGTYPSFCGRDTINSHSASHPTHAFDTESGDSARHIKCDVRERHTATGHAPTHNDRMANDRRTCPSASVVTSCGGVHSRHASERDQSQRLHGVPGERSPDPACRRHPHHGSGPAVQREAALSGLSRATCRWRLHRYRRRARSLRRDSDHGRPSWTLVRRGERAFCAPAMGQVVVRLQGAQP